MLVTNMRCDVLAVVHYCDIVISKDYVVSSLLPGTENPRLLQFLTSAIARFPNISRMSNEIKFGNLI